MADLFTVSHPMLVRYPDGNIRIIAETFKHTSGLVYVEPYWLASDKPVAALLAGEIKGDGPWKVGDVIVRLLSCADTEQKMQWAEWEQYLYSCDSDSPYHNEIVKREIINKMSFFD